MVQIPFAKLPSLKTAFLKEILLAKQVLLSGLCGPWGGRLPHPSQTQQRKFLSEKNFSPIWAPLKNRKQVRSPPPGPHQDGDAEAQGITPPIRFQISVQLCPLPVHMGFAGLSFSLGLDDNLMWEKMPGWLADQPPPHSSRHEYGCLRKTRNQLSAPTVISAWSQGATVENARGRSGQTAAG